MRFSWVPCSSLSRSIWMASCPSGVSAAHYSLVLSVDLLSVCSAPLLMSLMKILKSIGPSTDAWGGYQSLLISIQTLSCWPLLSGLNSAASSSFIEQTTHQIHIFPIWGEGCCEVPCQRSYWSPDRWHQWLFPCLLMLWRHHRKPLSWSRRICPWWSHAGPPLSPPSLPYASA